MVRAVLVRPHLSFEAFEEENWIALRLFRHLVNRL